jgi:hypothetical protein
VRSADESMLDRDSLLQDELLEKRAIRYALERKCRSGGFCFYKLEEPNGSDTWFALSILDLLHDKFKDEATIAYLRAMQHPDGNYDSIYSAYYSIKSLSLMGEAPKEDPRSYLVKHLGQFRFDARMLPAEVISMFKRTSYLVDLCRTAGIDGGTDIRERMIDFILSFQNEDGGFGHLRSTLHETSLALEMLQRLGFPPGNLETESFIRLCEMPVYGFVDIPHTSLGYLEFVHAGVIVSNILAEKPCYAEQCADFIRNCQNRNGGFSRTMHGGIASMEYTWYAVHALHLLSCP